MAYRDAGDDTRRDFDHGSTTRVPRWVKLAGIATIAVVLLIVVVMLVAGGGGHGPSRHALSGGVRGYTPPTTVTEDHTVRV